MESIERRVSQSVTLVAAFALAVLLFATTDMSAQTRKKQAAKKPVKPAAAKRVARNYGFPREPFDPRRDPFADLDAAKVIAKRDGKRIILDVGGEWCGWCIYMDRFFYERPEIDRLRRKYYVWVKVNMSPENENHAFLSLFPEISGYPHLFVLDADGQLLHSQSSAEFENRDGYVPEVVTQFLYDWSPMPQ